MKRAQYLAGFRMPDGDAGATRTELGTPPPAEHEGNFFMKEHGIQVEPERETGGRALDSGQTEPAGPGALFRAVLAKPALWSLFATVIFCAAVGIIVALASGSGFIASLGVSYSIGLSIHLCIQAGFRLFVPRVRPLIFVPAMSAVGIVAGLIIGGALFAGGAFAFLGGDYSTAVMALLFGGIGTFGFAMLYEALTARARLDKAARNALLQEKVLAEAELRVLQAQMEPHFLFNTLSNVIALVRTDPDKATRILELLSTLLRASLARARETEATLGEELDLVRAYLEIQALRMSDRLKYAVNAAPGIADLRLPPLLLQPLVENAVLHGVEPKVDGGRVDVSAELSGSEVAILVKDDGIGMESDQSGECVENVRSRLRGLFGERASLAISETPGGGTSAAVRIPAENAKERRHVG